MEKLFLGFDIGGTKCAVVTGTAESRILSRSEIATADYSRWQDVLNALIQAIPRGEYLAAGISCGGPLDSVRGMILSPPNLPGWDEVPIVEYLQSRLGIPVFLQNDANACALAEWQFGAGRGCKNMVFMTFGTGLGAGLILDGRLYVGTNDMAGEIGHVRAAADGPVGYGKRGSFEGFCSGGGILQLSGGESARNVVRRADAGDVDMQNVLAESAEKLGMCLSLLIDLLNPERIVIGSIYARAERWYKDAAQRVIDREALRYSAEVCRILPAELGDALGDYAALSVGINGLKTHNG